MRLSRTRRAHTHRRPGRNIAGLAAVVAVALTASACAGQTDEAASGLDGECPKVGAKPPKDAETVTYWSMWTKGEPQQKVLQHAFDCFTEQTGVEVDVEWFGRKMLTQNVAPALNTDDVPDLIDQDVSQVNAAVGKPGGLQDVSDVMQMENGEGDKKVGDVIDEQYWDMPQNELPDGGQMLVPYELLANGWWYDESQVENFEEPETTEDLFALFDEAKKNGKAAVSQDGDIDFYNAYFFTQWAEKYVGPGGVLKAAKDESGKAWTENPGFLKAAKLVERLAKGDYFIDGWDASKFPNIQNQWADGKSRYIFVGSWVTSETSEYLKKQSGGAETEEIDYASFQMPMPEGATHHTIEQMPIGFALLKKAKNPDAAKSLISYVTNKEIISGFSSVAKNLVPRKDVEAPAELADIKEALEAENAEPTVFMDSIDGLLPTYTTDVFYPLDNKLLGGDITAEEFIKQMSEKSEKYWAAN